MNIASVIGLVLGLAMLIFGILSNGESVLTYLHATSALITFGGALASTLTSTSLTDFLNGIKSIRLVFMVSEMDTSEMIRSIIDLSNVARKEGLLSLEEAAADLEEPFLKKGILLIVDGTDPDLVRAIMETELESIEARHKAVTGFWDTLGTMGPAWGMVGTLVGLVSMLNHMQNIDVIGPAMAVALMTTLYGSLLANWLCIPVSNKLKENNALEIQQKEIMIEGLLSIQAGENPRVIEEKLKSFLSPKDREANEGEEAGGEE